MITNEELENRITALRADVDNLKTFKGQLQYPANPQSKASVSKLLDELLVGKIFDLFWNKFLYMFDEFSSLDGWVKTGSGSSSLSFGRLVQSTGAVLNQNARAEKYCDAGLIFNFGKQQRFRTDAAIDTATAITCYIVAGSIAAGDSHYGFKIVDSVLYGISCNEGTTSTTAALQTMTVDTLYQLEARLDFQAGIVIFYINNVEKAVLTSNLPKQSAASKNFGVVHTRDAKTTDTADKSMYGTHFEFMVNRISYFS